MKLVRLSMDNYKGATDESLDISNLTALVGANSTGKTAILEALHTYFTDAGIPRADFTDRERPIRITVTFADVPGVQSLPSITRLWNPGEGDVAPVQDIDNPGLTRIEQEGVIKSVHSVLVRAEHETDNDTNDLELIKLIQGAITSAIYKTDTAAITQQRDSYYDEFREHASMFEKMMNTKLCGGSETSTFPGYAPGSSVEFVPKSPSLTPNIETMFLEHGQRRSHRSVGHGTKRAYYMAALETATEMRAKSRDHAVLILIDEPELHQYPQRQKRILRTLQKLAGRRDCQIVYTTHSPNLIDLRGTMDLHNVSRSKDNKVTIHSARISDKSLANKRLSRHVADGIFSNGAILVEGMHDEAILSAALSVAEHEGRPVMQKLLENDVNIIECEGINNILYFIRFFRNLGIRTFVIWDADQRASNKGANKILLEELKSTLSFDRGLPLSEYLMGDDFACFGRDTCLYFGPYLGLADNADEQAVRKFKQALLPYEDIIPRLQSDAFRQSRFATELAPKIYDYF